MRLYRGGKITLLSYWIGKTHFMSEKFHQSLFSHMHFTDCLKHFSISWCVTILNSLRIQWNITEHNIFIWYPFGCHTYFYRYSIVIQHYQALRKSINLNFFSCPTVTIHSLHLNQLICIYNLFLIWALYFKECLFPDNHV